MKLAERKSDCSKLEQMEDNVRLGRKGDPQGIIQEIKT